MVEDYAGRLDIFWTVNPQDVPAEQNVLEKCQRFLAADWHILARLWMLGCMRCACGSTPRLCFLEESRQSRLAEMLACPGKGASTGSWRCITSLRSCVSNACAAHWRMSGRKMALGLACLSGQVTWLSALGRQVLTLMVFVSGDQTNQHDRDRHSMANREPPAGSEPAANSAEGSSIPRTSEA